MADVIQDSKTKTPDERPKRKGKGLGRGLDALFEQESLQSPAGQKSFR